MPGLFTSAYGIGDRVRLVTGDDEEREGWAVVEVMFTGDGGCVYTLRRGQQRLTSVYEMDIELDTTEAQPCGCC